MKANELRVGNLVDLGNRITKVIEINHSACVVVDLEETQDTIEDYERTKPILLTEEWCIKFGFQKDLENTIYKNINKHCFLCYDDNIVLLLEEENNWCITKVKYVHQLQNLHFALTGEEIVVKE
jgi:hypothetical protein